MELNEIVVTSRGLISTKTLDVVKLRDEKMTEADHLVNTALDKGIDVSAFRQYRQALRDIPQNFSDAQDVVWPTKPQLSQS